MKEKNEILTAKEVKEYLWVPLSTLHWLCRQKNIPAFKVGRHWRFRREKLEKWLKRQENVR
jgi:excisionase family DNA binding protein